MNVQVLTDPFGKLLWASPALPGAVHDAKAARTHGIPEALARTGVRCWADKAYQGAGPAVRVPCRGRREKLSAGQKAVNRAHAKIRAVGEQAMATLKNWRLLRKLRCSTTASPTWSRPSSSWSSAPQREIGKPSVTRRPLAAARWPELTVLKPCRCFGPAFIGAL